MSNPYSSQPPKRLVRSTSNRVIGGVCGGVADYLNMDATLVRVLTVLISLFTGVPVILYIIALFIVPEGSTVPTAPPPVTGASTYSGPFTGPQSATPPPAYAPFPNAGTGAAGTARPTAEDTVWGSEGAPWEQRQPDTTATTASEPAPQPAAPSEPEAPVVPPENEEPKAT
jgi:phage shock protein PspC (stress-responsive transcriptional regulator)